jgi:hypothetical protein
MNDLDKMEDSQQPPVLRDSKELFKKVQSMPEHQIKELENHGNKNIAQNPSHKNKKSEQLCDIGGKRQRGQNEVEEEKKRAEDDDPDHGS